MILLPEFDRFIKKELAGAHPLHHVFVHFLFPEEYRYPESANRVLQGIGTYQRVAILGFKVARNQIGPPVFEKEMNWLASRDLDGSELPNHRIALFGLTLGLKALKNGDLREWFRIKLLERLPEADIRSGFKEFLIHLVYDNRYANEPPLHKEFECYLMIARAGDRKPARWDFLRDYFLKMRKREFPVDRSDFFRSLLSVWIMDRLLDHCVWDPQRMDKVRKNNLKPVRDSIARKAFLRARVLGAMITLGGWLVLAGFGYFFFVTILEVPAYQSLWNALEKTLILIGGPVALAISSLRLIFYLFTGKSWKWEYEAISRYLRRSIERRFLRRYNFPEQGS